MAEKIQRFYPFWLELIAPALLAFAWAYSAYNYALLPDIIPTHFGTNGLADDWSPKGFWSVYLPLLIGTLVWLSMILINYFLIIKPDDPGKYMSMSKREKDRLGPVYLENIRMNSARGLMMINLTVTAMIATMHYGFINTALGIQKGLGWMTIIFVLALLIESIWLIVKTKAINYTFFKS